MKTAILIDGGFFVRRYKSIKSRGAPEDTITPQSYGAKYFGVGISLDTKSESA